MPEEIGLFDAMATQRAIRYFKPDPVPDDLVRTLIEWATKAPSGGNRQPWSFVVIRNADAKRSIGEYYRRAWEATYGSQASSPASISPRVKASATHLAETLHQVPVMILACIQIDGAPSPMARGASIYPAVQNLLLAARGLGLGSVITTLHKQYEREIKDLLGIPDKVETAALLPIGYPAEGAGYGTTRRRAIDDVVHRERWESKG